VYSEVKLDDGLELEVIVVEDDEGNDEQGVADGEHKDLSEEESVRLQCGGRQENSLRTVCSDS
jgi:hypothetical protein